MWCFVPDFWSPRTGIPAPEVFRELGSGLAYLRDGNFILACFEDCSVAQRCNACQSSPRRRTLVECCSWEQKEKARQREAGQKTLPSGQQLAAERYNGSKLGHAVSLALHPAGLEEVRIGPTVLSLTLLNTPHSSSCGRFFAWVPTVRQTKNTKVTIPDLAYMTLCLYVCVIVSCCRCCLIIVYCHTWVWKRGKVRGKGDKPVSG